MASAASETTISTRTQHTPGPWRATDDTPYYDFFDIEADRGCVAELVKTKADARLISAAPDMLRELKAICENIEPDCDEPDCPDCAAWRPARAAIAKAEGR